ncbi:class I SAM-dependent methyltransferase [Robiginitalea sp. IMCC44478]|uniref:class I SAM-dependent methyltransferase n=1 Tax=Robiginitalea sp. IMCC44478 TaxID=3459122 RepID=UPI004040FFE5
MDATKEHWEHIYQTKPLDSVSWYQPVPRHSLDLIATLELPKDTPVIDIGGGDSLLADHLLDLGYLDITVLDVSAQAIKRAKSRLGESASAVHWIESDIRDFKPERSYGLWHDRAAFHFLTAPPEIEQYVALVSRTVSEDGYFILGTFSEKGPEKCSGLPITQYSIEAMKMRFKATFEPIDCRNIAHQTPSGGKQDFTFCCFSRVGD